MVFTAALLLAGVASSPAQRAAVDPCLSFEQAPTAAAARTRLITARDLVTIADIGRADPYDSESPFEVSPDGRWIAFLVRRGNPDTNSYCQRLMIAPMSGTGAARELDRGSEFVRPLFSLRNLPAVRAGYAKVITPHWSPDGNEVAYLKRGHGKTQVWVASVVTGTVAQASYSPSDVQDFRWSRDGRGLIIAKRPELAQAESAIDKEALTGFHFDARFSPMMSDRPFPVGSFPTRYFHLDLTTGFVRAAEPSEIALVDPTQSPDRPEGAISYADDRFGDRAWTEVRSPAELLSPLQLQMRWKTGRQILCTSELCRHIRHLWWSESSGTLFFVTSEGWRQSITALYRWNSDEAQPIKIFSTEDALVGCTLVTAEIVCADEGSTMPRRLVAIESRTGDKRLIYNPNPQFRAIRLGQVRRLRYRNRFGIECYSDLILPPDHKPGQQHPLVVVQYISEGFLRGGIGDEFPIQVLAAKGFAVLSFERPFDPPGTEGATSELDYRRRMRKGWIDRRSVESGLERGVQAAIGTGTVDPKRIGITGFSEGTAAVQWALINSRLFKVAALGVCCEDKVALPLNGGIGYEQYLEEMGYPLFQTGEEKFWAPYSLAQNAEKITAPILIQTTDDEYEAGLDVLEEFRKRGKPIDLYIFDHEPHFVWQPAHRLAMYRRSVQWFEFWFMAKIDCHPVDSGQYPRWKEMRGAPKAFTRSCRADSSAS